jgi:hypothetical protein
VSTVTDARVLNIRETRWEALRDDVEQIAEDVRQVRKALAGCVTYITLSDTATVTQITDLTTVGWHELTALAHPDEDHLNSWRQLADLESGNGGSVEPSSRATGATGTTVSSIRRLLRRRWRDQRLADLSPERRALYEGISSLRESIGKVDFNILESLRELRSNG